MRLDSVLANLPELVGGHVLSRDRVAIVIEDEACSDANRFVQFLATQRGELVAECVSNRYLSPGHEWTSEDEVRLFEIGFEPPQPAFQPRPNWWCYRVHGVEAVLPSCRMVADALVDVLRLPMEALVTIIERTLGQSPRWTDEGSGSERQG